MSEATTMTRRERQDLSEIVKRRGRVTKASLETLAADREAEVERQLSAIHRADEDQWKAITTEAQRLVGEAAAQIARICDERGIPKEFRPRLHLNWWERGDNASASRRAELRKLAFARIDADRKAGLQLIERIYQEPEEIVAERKRMQKEWYEKTERSYLIDSLKDVIGKVSPMVGVAAEKCVEACRKMLVQVQAIDRETEK